MAIDPMTMMAAAGAIGGLFGSGSSISPEQEKLLRIQKQQAKSLQQYGQGVPGSDPQELQLLASQRGLLGQQQRAMMGGLFGNLGATGSPAPMDMLQNMGMQFGGQQSAMQSNLFNQFFQNRRNAMLQSAQVAAGAVPAAQPNQPGFDFGAIFGPLAQAYAYRQSLQGAQLQPRQRETIYHPVTPATQAPRTGPFGLRF